MADWTELARAAAPAVAGLVSLVHPAVAALRKKRRDRLFKETMTQQLQPVVKMLQQLETRIDTLERLVVKRPRGR